MTVQGTNKTPKVTVVMPVLNGERTVKTAIDSVLAQTFRDFELIICNDASTDGTSNILENISDNRVTVLRNEFNIGQGPSRDRSICHAQGTWLAVIDADDYWLPVRLETLLSVASETDDQLIFDDIFECHDTPSGMVRWRELRGKHAFGGNGIDAIDVEIEDYVRLERQLIKPLFPLRYIKQYSISHSTRKFWEDIEFFLRLMAQGLTPRYVPQAMYFYRITPSSMTGIKIRTPIIQEILETMIEQFSHAPSVQSALKDKIAMVKREGTYMPFVWALKEKKFVDAIRLATKYPWIFPEFLRRVGRSFPYHGHRLWHDGRKRGVQ